MKKIICYIIGFLTTLSLVVVLFLTSAEIGIFGSLSFFHEQYEANSVYENVKMEKEDLLYVTEYFLDYLNDSRDDLLVETYVDGEKVQFFNEREILHMEDVKDLFLIAYDVRIVCVVVLFVGIILLALLKADVKKVMGKSILIGLPVIGLFSGSLAYVIAQDFNKAFIKFHYMVFTNELWYLNPETDRLINIVPEAFFVAITIRMAVIFAIFVLFTFIIGIFLVRYKKERKNIAMEL